MVVQTQSSSSVEGLSVLLIAEDTAARKEIYEHLRTELREAAVTHIHSPDQIENLSAGRSYALCIVGTSARARCLEAVRRLRRRQPECPVLVMLELDSEELGAEAHRQGVDDYIIKTPGYGKRLRAAFSRLIESPARKNEAIRTLQANARQFQAMVENSAHGVLIHVDGVPVYANAALARILDCADPSEVIGLDPIDDIVDARDRSRVLEFLRRHRAGADGPETCVFRARRRDGSLIWLENRVNALDWEGRPGVQCTMVDVTGRQRATNALRLAARVASRAGAKENLEEAIRVTLRWLGRGMGWDLAESWIPDHTGVLRAGPVWCRDPARFRRFVESSKAQVFKAGEGLPGRVWEQGSLEWMEDLAMASGRFRRSILANAAGLRTACGVPIVASGRTVAVLCFFLTRNQVRDDAVVNALSAGTASLGAVLLQIQGEQARRASLAQTEVLITRNVDGILVVDEEDQILFANPAAEEAFGRDLESLRGMPFGTPSLESGVAEIEIHSSMTDAGRIKEMRVADIHWDGHPARLVSLRDVTERNEARDEVERHRAALQERVKELKCLYAISEHLSRSDITWAEILRHVAEAIPAGFLYPEALRARLKIQDVEVATSPGRTTGRRLSSEVRVHGEPVGEVEVWYAVDKPARDIGPFLEEERNLLEDIVRRIGQTISIRRYQQELDASRRRFQDFAEAASDWLWEMDENFRFTYFSERIESVMGQPVSHWLGKSRLEITGEHVEGDPKWLAHRAELEAHRPFKHFRYQVVLPDGGARHIAISGVPVFDEQGGFRGYRGTGTDETRQVEASARAQESDQRLQGIADGLPGIVFQRLRKPDGTIEYPYLSAGTFDMLGYTPAEIQGDPLLWSDLIHPEDRPRFDVATAESMRSLEPLDMQLRMSTRSGESRWAWHRSRPRRLDNGDTVWDCIELDITEQKKAEARVQYLGYHDQLTALPNRELFVERVNQVLPIAFRNRQPVAVAMLGLKRFKRVNEEFGMSGGDEVLRTAAERFKECLRPGDTVARLGGDRFLFLLPSVGADPRTHKPFERLLQAMEQPFTIKNRQILLTFNMGVALFPDHGDSTEELIQKADTAQAHYGRWGPGFGYTLYQDRMPQSDTSRLALEKELRDAIDSDDQLVPYFQPIYSSGTGRLVGVETLARWKHPERGLIPPAEFIELAEETGLIIPLGLTILRQACRQARQWQRAGLPRLLVNVNLSVAQIRDPDLSRSIRGVLDETGFPAEQLVLEVTESTLITNLDNATQFMEELVAEGVNFALDDFGVGYSSLSYLGRLPVQTLKIDRSFTRDLRKDPRSETTIKAIAALAHALDLHVVAEGIETPEQLVDVRRLGCDSLQGFLLGKPMSPDVLESRLAEMLPLDAMAASPVPPDRR